MQPSQSEFGHEVPARSEGHECANGNCPVGQTEQPAQVGLSVTSSGVPSGPITTHFVQSRGPVRSGGRGHCVNKVTKLVAGSLTRKQPIFPWAVWMQSVGREGPAVVAGSAIVDGPTEVAGSALVNGSAVLIGSTLLEVLIGSILLEVLVGSIPVGGVLVLGSTLLEVLVGSIPLGGVLAH